ncbi:TonB family protein [Coraliomargarita akajimensis]|uniref:TonB family protein n=1 Tax=Coraliomargarita akajimensis (strain DSM 45221 / IAM 15411 / JCM 23193 / KCTC 12865 / 04OKA010-24) TaxID=583355 RepID=D5EQG6_CORAD|nr:TonB family protein [Coraliomargarita akajimensis]ADE55780.1 TonB family protein [Coraliomargarita akajimensis DSM 45221]
MAVKLPKDQPFWASVILHTVVLVALFLATIIQAFKPKKEEHVFEMVSMPEDLPVAELNTAPDVPPPPDLPDIPDIDIPEPTPQPPVPPAPKPTPQPPKPKPEPVQEMSYEDFLKQHGKPKPRQQPRPQPVTRDLKVDKVDVGQVHVPTHLPKSQQPTRAEMDALQRYIAALGANLDRAWRRPQSLGGSRLAVTVFFDVSSSGVITNIRFRPSSGDATFDQSVRAAFRAVRSPGPTPTGRSHTFEKTFRMLD